MAQFKSASREGSYSDKQLIVPDAVKKLQSEASRKLSGMDRAQAHLEKNQAIFLQAQKQAQGIEQDSKASISNIKQGNIRVQRKASEVAYQKELEREQNQAKKKVDLLSNLVGWAPTAIKLAEGIVKQNNELQQKAINQNSFTHNLTHKDVLAAKSVDSSISNSQWQETEQVQQMQRDGKSQEFIDFMFNDMIRGGGYRNYINNSIVLDNQGRINAQTLTESVNSDIAKGVPADEVLKNRNALEAQLRGALTLDGKTPASIIESKGYNQRMQRALDRTDTLTNKYKSEALTEDTRVKRANTIIDRLNTDGVAGMMALAETSSSPGVVDEMTDTFLAQNPTADELEIYMKNPFNRNGELVTLAVYPKNMDKVMRYKNKLKQATIADIALENQVLQAETDAFGAQLAEEYMADDIFSEAERQKLITAMDAKYPNRDRSNDRLYKTLTIDVQMQGIIKDQLDGFVANNLLSESLMDEMEIPLSMEGPYRNIAKQLDKVRASDEFKGLRKYLNGRFSGSMTEVKDLKWMDGSATQSDQIEWYIKQKENKGIKLYMAAVMAGDPNAAQTVGDKLVLQMKEELGRPGFVVSGRIVDYDKTLEEGTADALMGQRMRTRYDKYSAQEKSNPNTWVELVGENSLQAASKELAEKGSSEVLRVLGAGSSPPLTVWEAHEKLAEVNPNIESIEIPTYMELYKELPASIRNVLASNKRSTEEKLEAANKALRQFGQQTEAPAVRSTFSQATVPLEGTIQEKGNQAVTYMTQDLGLSDFHAYGLLANAIRESSLNTTNPGDKNTSDGWFQWHKGRLSRAKAALGNEWNDWRAQIRYALQEEGEPGQEYLQQNFSSRQEAADWWMKYWERPAHPERDSKRHSEILGNF